MVENQDKINHGKLVDDNLYILFIYKFVTCFSFILFTGNWAEAKLVSEISGPVAIEFGSQTYVTAMDNGLFTLGPPHDEG